MDSKTQTERKCIVTGNVEPLSALLRFVVTPEKMLVPDFDKKLDGRGLYVCVSQKLLKKALEKQLFAKSLRAGLKISDDLVEQTKRLLCQKALSWMNLARKAGVLVTGFEKVKASLLKHKAAFLIEASDASEDVCKKLDVASGDIEVFKVYDSSDLSAALKTENTVYIAVLKSDIASKVYENMKRYQTFLEN